MLESSEVEGGGVATVVRSTYSSTVKSPEEEGGGGATPEEDSTRAFRASSHLSRSLPKEGGTYRSYNVYKLRCRKLL